MIMKRFYALSAALAAALAGCSSSGHAGHATSSRATSSATTAAAAANAVPAQLAGVWQTRFQGQPQYLAFSGTAYKVYVVPSDAAQGSVRVSGANVTFFGSNTCSGAGTYHWSIQAGKLHFQKVSADPCPRANLLPSVVWTPAPAS
jgi:hypothetical protein